MHWLLCFGRDWFGRSHNALCIQLLKLCCPQPHSESVLRSECPNSIHKLAAVVWVWIQVICTSMQQETIKFFHFLIRPLSSSFCSYTSTRLKVANAGHTGESSGDTKTHQCLGSTSDKYKPHSGGGAKASEFQNSSLETVTHSQGWQPLGVPAMDLGAILIKNVHQKCLGYIGCHGWNWEFCIKMFPTKLF